MDDKWFFYLTLILALFFISSSRGLVHENPLFKGCRGTAVQSATVLAGPAIKNNVVLITGGR